MKQHSRLFFFSALIFFLLGISAVKAQTFVAPDTVNNLGLTDPGGLMGFAWGDYDADGDLDMLLVNQVSVLYRNDVNVNGQFTRVSGTTQAEDSVFFDPGGNGQNSANMADLNGDGKLDIIVGPLRIHLQDDDSVKFHLIGELLPTALSTGGWGSTAADFDHDGDVDLAITGGVASNAAGIVHVFLNDGDANFTDVGESLIGSFVFESWAPQFVDIDNDTWLDLWISDIRNTEPCAIFHNAMGSSGEMVYLGPGETGITEESSIISSWADFDNDGYLDVYTFPLTADDATGAKLYKNNGDGTFINVGPSAGVDSAYNPNGTRCLTWGDYNNDGFQDLLVFRRDTYHQELYKNNGDGTFTNVGTEEGLTIIGADLRSGSFVDYDNDGNLDVYVMQNSTNPPRIYHNEGGNGNHWIAFKPKAIDKNTVAVGTRIEVHTGDLHMVRYVQAGGPGGTNGYLFPHFGLGSATTIDSVVVTWPKGNKEVLTNVVVDSYNEITETLVGVSEETYAVTSYALMQNYPNPFNPSTTIAFNLPERSEVSLVLVDVLGKVVKNIAAGTYEAGLNKVNLDASNLATGVYFYKLQAGQFTSTKKLVVLK